MKDIVLIYYHLNYTNIYKTIHILESIKKTNASEQQTTLNSCKEFK